MPVGTAATVKGISAEQLRSTDAQMVLSNTFHLHLQPGESIVAAAGGLHRFMGWSGPMLTDSGGFQVFSLASLSLSLPFALFGTVLLLLLQWGDVKSLAEKLMLGPV